MNVGRGARRLIGFLVHNWLLKLAALVVAALLYVGLVATQDSNVTTGPITITPVNQPSASVITNQLRDVEQVRYIAPADLGRLQANDFRATVDLANVTPDGTPVSLRVNVVPVDPRVTIVEIRPRSIQVVLDQSAAKAMKITVVHATPPGGLQLGDVTVAPAEVQLTGPAGAVNRVVLLRVTTPIDASGLDVDREFQPDPLDASGQVVTGVELTPATVHVNIPVYTNKETRTVPVNPIVTGSPAAGFRVTSIAVRPLVVSVQGDGDQLEKLQAADTAPIAISGATRDVTATVALALPNGVSLVGGGVITVTVGIEPITETRTYVAGLRLDGMRGDLLYDVSDLAVLLTLFGSTADLDTLGAAPIVVAISVADLDAGTHEVAVVPSLPSGVTVVLMEPATVTVTVAPKATPVPEPTATAPPVPTPTPSP